MEKLIMPLKSENSIEEYELLDIVKFEGFFYTVFYPTKPGETEVLILRVDESENPEESVYSVIQDERIINEVYKIFKNKYKDEIKFDSN